MNNSTDSTRLERITNNIADFAESRLTEAGQKMSSVFINDAESWLMNSYEKWKRSKACNFKYKELQKYVEVSNETIQIGMDKKELAVMWAMRKLGYTQEKIQGVLDLANAAYLPEEKR